MRASKKAILVMLFLGIGLFGYSQYIAASNISVIVLENKFLEKNQIICVKVLISSLSYLELTE